MAMIIEGVTTCALCGEQLAERPYMATSGVWYDRGEELFDYCDAPMHWDCYERWPHRERFAEDYARSRSEMNAGNPYWETVYQDEHLYLAVSRAAAHAWIRATGTSISFPAHAWPLPEGGSHPLERRALELSGLAEKFPEFQDLLDKVDWDAKFQLCERMARDVEERHERRRMQVRAASEGLTCPGCGRQTRNLSFEQSSVVCGECQHVFQPR